MSTPNVALFASAFAPHVGGVEELSRRIASELRRRESDTIVVTNRYPSDLPATEKINEIPVYRQRFRMPEPRARHFGGWLVGTRAARNGVAGAIKQHACDLIHVQCVSSNGYYALRAARALDVPLVVSMQGELTMDAGQAFQRSAVLRRTWRALLTRADVVTGCSQQVVDEAVDAFGPELASKARVVRNGVDLAAVRSVSPYERDRPYVLGIGRHVPQKGLDVLIDAFAMVSDEFSDVDLLIAGAGPEHEALRARAAGQRVEFVGSVPAEQAFSLFRGASAFVLSSRHEPQGIVVIEAMAAGAPVLATRVGGVPETVRDGENGLLVPGGDPHAMAGGLRRVLSDHVGAETRAARATSDVEAYSWTRIVDQYEQCYSDAIDRHRGDRG